LRQHPEWQQVPSSDEEYMQLQAEVVGWLVSGDNDT